MARPFDQREARACFGVTEPNTGLDTLELQSHAARTGNHYSVKGYKIWILTAQSADKILLLIRTTPLDRVEKPSHGRSLFFTDIDRTQIDVTEIPKMGCHAIDTNIRFYDGGKVPREGLIGVEALGLGFDALRRAASYAQERAVFGRPIGENQGIQPPLADSWMKLEAARLVDYQAAKIYDQYYATGEYANAGKYFAVKAAFEACERSVLAHGGMGYAKEYYAESYFREAMLPRIAPVSEEMICNYIREKVLGLPRSY